MFSGNYLLRLAGQSGFPVALDFFIVFNRIPPEAFGQIIKFFDSGGERVAVFAGGIGSRFAFKGILQAGRFDQLPDFFILGEGDSQINPGQALLNPGCGNRLGWIGSQGGAPVPAGVVAKNPAAVQPVSHQPTAAPAPEEYLTAHRQIPSPDLYRTVNQKGAAK